MYLWMHSTMSYAVQHYFLNGGTDAIIVRIINSGSKATLSLPAGGDTLTLEASNDGDWGNALQTTVDLETRDRDESSPDREYTREELEQTIESAIQIIEYARLSLTEPIEETIERHMHGIEEAIDRQKQELESRRKEIEREINNDIIAGYFKSWMFRIPIAILIIAVVFAVTGTIQIQQ